MLRAVVARLLRRVAPEVCPVCEGGSGVQYDERLKVARPCPACHGTGRSTLRREQLEAMLEGRAATTGSDDNPRSAA